jgi:photosystem II stability/assembly factor-like uncharacterized protein
MNSLRITHIFSYRRINNVPFLFMMLLTLAGVRVQAQTFWNALGPAGGDARAFAAEPGQTNHIYLGTTNSWIYESTDRGSSWHRLSKLDSADDLVLDHIIVDPTNHAVLYVAAWEVGQTSGGLWISRDAGKSWSEVMGMHGQSIRALAQAPTDPKMLVAGTRDGVYRSRDAGLTWTLISPPGNNEMRDFESVAIDPVNPEILYAGTWHLPWKSVDGGKTWHNIKQGLIVDSDVFSIILDPVQPNIAYLSACSGIYKSENAGELFHKIQGIPMSARRTRKLLQDPVNRQVVYAGTTEGLYKTTDGGKTFARMTGPDVIVNDVFVDPNDTQHVLLATDRGGVLYSRDAANSFAASNEGFSGRKVETLLVDRDNPARIFAGVSNDKSYGGVFVSSDGGAGWDHIGEGLEGRDVFTLAQAPDGTVLAGTNRGIFALNAGTADHPNDKDPSPPHQEANTASREPRSPGTPKFTGTSWQSRNTIQSTLVEKTTVISKGKKVTTEKVVKDKARELDGRVYALDLTGDAWLASTSDGLFTSHDQGASWQGGLVMGSGQYVTVAAHGSTMAAARRDGLVVSTDAGLTWTPVETPTGLTRIHRATFSADGTLWLGTREGVYFTRDQGKTWEWFQRLPFRDVNDLYYDARLDKLLVSSLNSDLVYFIDPVALTWKWREIGGFRILLIRSLVDRLLAASLYDGVVVESAAVGSKTGQR